MGTRNRVCLTVLLIYRNKKLDNLSSRPCECVLSKYSTTGLFANTEQTDI